MNVNKIENCFVELSDGCRIALSLWLPEGDPAPAILNVSPYGKKDMNAAGDEALFGYFAQHGYAGVRADLRGNGESTGQLLNMGAQPEWNDVCEILAWIETQPWCDGNVGMWGFSWGGIEAFSTAAFKQPLQLKTIVAGGFSTDKYVDGPFFMGGVLLRDTFGWLTSYLAMRARAPDPQAVGDSWLEEWKRRIDELEPIFDRFLAHQVRDEFWRRDAASERIGSVVCPMLLWSGLLEPAMTNSEVEIASQATSPTRLVVGPWAHKRPYEGRPAPAIGFLQEAVRWYDYWLRGATNNQATEVPQARLWLQARPPTQPFYSEVPGRWLAFDSWPPPTRGLELHLSERGLAAEGETSFERDHRSGQAVGLAGGERNPYLAYTPSAELPGDQRVDDALSMCFDGEVLDAPLNIIGRPVVHLDVAVDRPKAFVCVRLCDIAPDGSSTRIGLGILNLQLREGLAQPVPVVPGRRYRVTIPCDFVSYAIAPGHRLRLALSNTYWPLCWPSPEPVKMTVSGADARLVLPVLDNLPDAEVAFEAPETAPALQVERKSPSGRRDWQERHLDAGLTAVITKEEGEVHLPERGLTFGGERYQRLSIVDDQPLSAKHEVRVVRTTRREESGWDVRVEVTGCMSATAKEFSISLNVAGYRGNERTADKSWQLAIPRLTS